MPTIVQLPDSTELEFPDSMSQEDMNSEILKAFPQFSKSSAPASAPADEEMDADTAAVLHSQAVAKEMQTPAATARATKPFIPLPEWHDTGQGNVLKRIAQQVYTPVKEMAETIESRAGMGLLGAGLAAPEVVGPALAITAVPQAVREEMEAQKAALRLDVPGAVGHQTKAVLAATMLLGLKPLQKYLPQATREAAIDAGTPAPSQEPATVPESVSKPPSRPAVAKPPRPEVPETPPESMRGVTVLEEIRAAGADTKTKVQALFPHLTREEAGRLRDQAFPRVKVPDNLSQADVERLFLGPERARTEAQLAPPAEPEPAPAPKEVTPSAEVTPAPIESQAKPDTAAAPEPLPGTVASGTTPAPPAQVESGGAVSPVPEAPKLTAAPEPAAPEPPKKTPRARKPKAVEPPAPAAAKIESQAAEKEPWQMTREEAFMGRPIPLEQGWTAKVRYLDNPAGPNRGTVEIWQSEKPEKGKTGIGPFGRYEVTSVSRERPSRKQSHIPFWEKWDAEHKAEVEKAAKEGKPVPANVLGEYPELQASKQASLQAESAAPSQAAAKVESEVKAVARTEGQRPAKEVKSELIQRIEDAMHGAPEKSQWKASEHGYVDINIPGDGNFRIARNLEALSDIRKRAEKISITPGSKNPAKATTERPSIDPDDIAATAKQIYGEPRKAIASLERQISNPEFLKDAGIQDPYPYQRAIELLRDELPEAKLDKAIADTERELGEKESAIKIAEERMRVRRQMSTSRSGMKDQRFAQEQQTIINDAQKEVSRLQRTLTSLKGDRQRLSEGTPPEPTKGPGMVGMGGATPEEFAPGGAAGMDIYGIAERVRQRRAAAGQTLPVEPGQGISPADSVERGRTLLNKGADPERSLSNFERTKKLSADDMALVRAQGEALFQSARQIESKFGTESEEYVRAFKKASDWDKRSKAMQTEWHKMGQAQQGETDIDTGSFTGLQRAYGDEFTPKQAKQAHEHVAATQKAEAELATTKAKLLETLKQLEQAEAAKPRFSDYVLKTAEKWVNQWGKEAEVARKALAGKFLSPSPADLLNLAKIARYDIAQIGLDFAKWTDKMVQEFGPKVRPYLEDAWNKGREMIDEMVAKVPNKEIGQQVKRKITKQADPATDLRKRLRDYIDAGEEDPEVIFSKIATDTGMPIAEVRKALTVPAKAKPLSDEMFRKMAQRRKVVSAAKAWVKDQRTPGWIKFMRAVPRIFFIDKVFGHGTVGMITHAGMQMFNPFAWKAYWPSFFRQFGLVFNRAYHERMMQDMTLDPNYVTARRAGLVNDPFRYADDYQNAAMKGFFGKFSRLIGGEGFDALKLFRQARFNQDWNRLPESLKTPEMAKLIANDINHASGVVKMPFREWTGWTFFAPKLEGSRWAWMFADPAKAGRILAEWGKASPEERQFAMQQVKQKAAIAGVYFGLLAMNQGLLSAMGSKQKINFTDPKRTDFLAFKVAGHNIGIVGPMLGMVRLLANLLHAAVGKRGQVESLSSRGAEFGEIAGQYLRGKLSPFAGQVVNVAAQSDFQGRPLPWSKDRVPAYLRARGVKRYSWGEYAAQEFTPIPVSEAIREVWASQGMNESQIETWLKAITVGAVAGATGARIVRDYPKKEKARIQ